MALAKLLSYSVIETEFVFPSARAEEVPPSQGRFSGSPMFWRLVSHVDGQQAVRKQRSGWGWSVRDLDMMVEKGRKST